MISLKDYAGPHAGSPDWTSQCQDNASAMLIQVNNLLDAYYEQSGASPTINPTTGTLISGQTFGGFRPQSCPQGAPDSSHQVGRGVDIFDPNEDLDRWITDAILTQFDLYREAPDSTRHWCHLSDRAPHSGNRTFLP